MFDVAVSATLLTVFSPLAIVIAALVALESGWPVFFSQTRMGRDFQRFTLWKFRTMTADPAGARITVGGDKRITRIGGILRTTKMDEIPQLWNVLRGDMSLVGPRPELPDYVELYKERYRNVLTVRPGLTDLASLAYRNEEAVLASASDPHREYIERVLPRKLDLADEYLRRRSALLDCLILVRTLWVPWVNIRK